MSFELAAFGWILLNGILGSVVSRNGKGASQTLDHGSRAVRWFYRYCLFWCCFLLSFFLSPPLVLMFVNVQAVRDSPEWVRAMTPLAYPVPLAIVFYWIGAKFKRTFVASSTSAVPPVSSMPPMPVVRSVPACSPPVRVEMDEDTKRLDPDDDEAIRTLARKHWAALQAASAGQGSLDDASGAMLAVLDRYVPSLPPAVGRRVCDIYAAECDLQAGLSLVQMELAAAQRAEAVVAETRRKKRFALIIFIMLLVPVIGMIAVLATRL